MTILLAFATKKECAAALAGFGGPSGPSPGRRPGEVVSWRHRDRDFLVCVLGVGPVAAALSLGAALAGNPGVRGAINLGVAGTFEPELAPLGTAVAADLEIWPEFGLRTTGRVDPEGVRLPQLVTAAGPVKDRLFLDPEGAARDMGLRPPDGAVRGTSLTVAGVTAEAALARNMAETHGALSENMEGFACALACEAFGLPFLEIRTISNLVGSREPAAWNLPGALAALPGVFAALLG